MSSETAFALSRNFSCHCSGTRLLSICLNLEAAIPAVKIFRKENSETLGPAPIQYAPMTPKPWDGRGMRRSRAALAVWLTHRHGVTLIGPMEDMGANY